MQWVQFKHTGSNRLGTVFKARKCHLDFICCCCFTEKNVAIFISFHFDNAFFLTKGTLSERYSDTFRSRCGGITLQTELCIGSITFMCFCTEIRGNKALALQHFHIKHLRQVPALCRSVTDMLSWKKWL